MKKLLLIPLIVFCLKLSAAEYGVLEHSHTDNPSISLGEGDVLEVLGLSTSDGSEKMYSVKVVSNSGIITTHLNLFIYRGYDVRYEPEQQGPIVGPCAVSLSAPSGYNCRMSYKLTRASEVKTVTNSITIPAIADQEWAVTLERSTDLVNWETVAPGTVMGTDGLQFFRLRVGGETTTVDSTSTGGE